MNKCLVSNAAEFLVFLDFIHMHVLSLEDDFIVLSASNTYNTLTFKFAVGFTWSLE